MKLCIDCKYYQRSNESELKDTCLHDRAATGSVRTQSYYTCSAMRAGICGKEASLFVESTEVPL
jgi:hypothetical protein